MKVLKHGINYYDFKKGDSECVITCDECLCKFHCRSDETYFVRSSDYREDDKGWYSIIYQEINCPECKTPNTFKQYKQYEDERIERCNNN